jgi:hypothetical protein
MCPGGPAPSLHRPAQQVAHGALVCVVVWVMRCRHWVPQRVCGVDMPHPAAWRRRLWPGITRSSVYPAPWLVQPPHACW